ncbi:thiamine diphosphate-binding protein [Aspergillus pseudoustus]|uniref:Pyruvate decarboxylase n=1 Tax=Aspergillus pseudoustus TaxID=1810923 RepID=A0ABR4JYY9_9EURO
MGSIRDAATMPLAAYLWRRIRQLGVQSVMGVPGDMNLELLDYIDQVDGLTWVGNANELNAAYAADGYSRVKGCPGVLVTTMGVGELSAINGVAGAYTENVKLIHIVGTTGTRAQRARAMIHHCLGPDPDHRVYSKISQHVRAAHCWLDDVGTAPGEIDRVIRECYLHSLPVYIFVPMDFVHVPIPAAPIEAPVDLKPKTNPEACISAINAVIEEIETSTAPTVIVDALVHRFSAADVMNQLLDRLELPTFTTPMGKSIVPENKPYFYGVYNGQVSLPGVANVIENNSDLVVDIGFIHSDSNTGGHSRNISSGAQSILVAADYVQVGHARYENVYLVEFLTRLSETLSTYPLKRLPSQRRTLTIPPAPIPSDGDAKHITQSWIWKRIGSMARPGDILIGESGTAQFGFSDATFAPGVQYITQIYFGSIGYAVPACFGAAAAQAEREVANHGPGESGSRRGREGRTILVVGDGSLQLTVQEIGTMIKKGLRNVLIMVINNNGYTIERAIHGPEQEYNDITPWNHQLLLRAFGAQDGELNSRIVDTKDAFEEVISLPEYTHLDSIQLLEVMMDRMDVPWRLQAQIDLINERNARLKREKVENRE